MKQVSEVPCKKCITLSICLQIYDTDLDVKSINVLMAKCSIIKKYIVLEEVKIPRRVFLNRIHMDLCMMYFRTKKAELKGEELVYPGHDPVYKRLIDKEETFRETRKYYKRLA